MRLSSSRTVDGFTRICRASTFTAGPDRHRRQTSSTSAGDNPFRVMAGRADHEGQPNLERWCSSMISSP